MPTYQYRCTSCGDELEAVQRFTDDPLTECPACQGRLRKVFSPVGVVFKGSGFYKTDSRSTKPAAAGGNGKPDAQEPQPAAGKEAAKDKPSSPAGDGGAAKESKGATSKPAASTSAAAGTSTSTGSGSPTAGGSRVA